MQLRTPLSSYQQALHAGEYQPDEIQHQAVVALDRLYRALQQQQNQPVSVPAALPFHRKLLHRWIQKEPAPIPLKPVQGLYMWGGVGRGKTWLMDLFFHSLPGERKLRLHFHRFMLRVHDELQELQGTEDPLEKVADRFKAQTDVLCFDEFFVSNITDAMLLATLLKALFSRGITLVATSNIIPDNLYHNGLQRTRFLPAIDLIKQHCQIMNVDAGIDYRLRTLTQAHLYLTPLSDENKQQMSYIFQQLAGQAGTSAPILEINHRPLPALQVANGVLAIDFHTLCEEARSQLDYIALSRLYHSILLYNVRVMGKKVEQENSARRFLALVDEFYERRVKLVIEAEVPMFELYQGERLKFEFQRCLSRLQEMQSQDYLESEHLP